MSLPHLFLGVLLGLATGAAQLAAQNDPAVASQSMRAFMESPLAMQYYKTGGAAYVKNSGDQVLYAKLSYDYPDFAEATLTDANGVVYSTLARYNRQTRKIEALLNGRLFAIKESDVPEAIIGERSYRSALLITKSGWEPSYLEVQAVSDDGTRLAAKKFLIYQSSNQTQNRGIVTPGGTEAYKLDSVTYLIGFREVPFEVPRKSKLLVTYLDACEGRALQASGRFKHSDDEFMRSFIGLVSGCE